MQIDNLNELPKDKRPPDSIIWEGTSQDMDSWMDRVYKNKEDSEMSFVINDVEG